VDYLGAPAAHPVGRRQLRGHELGSLLLRALARDELGRIWTIARSELIETTYRLEDGALVLRPDPFDVRGCTERGLPPSRAVAASLARRV
jgi:hypothetical protein